jgi:gamma-glutamyltranspeptidase / glutathione hydrolase
VLAFLLLGAPARGASVAPAMGENGMVVTAQHLASAAGVEVLRQGGNAIDAAVAVGYALAVVYPAAGNLGGGGFMTIQLADGRKSFIDFRETAPLAASADMYLGADGKVLEGLSTQGQLAVAVPGTVAGLEMALARFGTRPRAVVLAPAIRLARQGFVLDEGDVRMLRAATEELRQDPASAAIFLKHGQPYEAGDRLVQADLARTLERIGAQGARGFYQGTDGRRDRGLESPGRGHPEPSRSRPVPGARAQAGRVRLSRLPCRLGAAAQRRWRHLVRDAQRARRLSAARHGLSLSPGGACADRGDAPCLRRSQ